MWSSFLRVKCLPSPVSWQHAEEVGMLTLSRNESPFFSSARPAAGHHAERDNMLLKLFYCNSTRFELKVILSSVKHWDHVQYLVYNNMPTSFWIKCVLKRCFFYIKTVRKSRTYLQKCSDEELKHDRSHFHFFEKVNFSLEFSFWSFLSCLSVSDD